MRSMNQKALAVVTFLMFCAASVAIVVYSIQRKDFVKVSDQKTKPEIRNMGGRPQKAARANGDYHSNYTRFRVQSELS